MPSLAFRQLQVILSDHLARAQDDARRMGATCAKATLILRDPDNPGMVICITNDDPMAAAAQATQPDITDHGKLTAKEAALALVGVDVG